jgi:glycosyltransferase involved in cell wall biosynthesis
VVVIDDGSSDGTAAAVERFIAARHLPFSMRLIRQANSGVGAARARAVAEGPPCDLLAMLDSDDLWPVDYLQTMGDALAGDLNAVGASCDRRVVDAVTGHVEAKPSSHLTVVRMDAFRLAGGYDTSLKYKDDTDLYLRMSLVGPWVYVPGIAVTLRRNTAHLGGPQHLTHKSIPNRLELATMLERFILERGGGQAIPERIWRPHLSRLWFRLGRELASAGQRPQAAWCFRRSTQLDPRRLRAWLRRIATGRRVSRPVIGG